MRFYAQNLQDGFSGQGLDRLLLLQPRLFSGKVQCKTASNCLAVENVPTLPKGSVVGNAAVARRFAKAPTLTGRLAFALGALGGSLDLALCAIGEGDPFGFAG